MPRLVVQSGPNEGLSCAITGVVIVGRDEGCDLVLDDPRVSREHVRVRLEGSQYVAEDLGATNTTQLNGAPITKANLLPGDELKVGRSMLILEEDQHRGAGGSTFILESDQARIQASMPAEEQAGLATVATLEELRESFELFRQVGEALGSAVAVDDLLQGMLAELFRVFEQADHGFVILAEGPEGPFHIQAQRFRRGRPEELGLSRTIIQHVVSRNEAVLSQDAAVDSRFQGAQSIVSHNIRSVICAPLICTGETLGAILVDTTDARQPFSKAELATLAVLAPQAALRIRHAKLVEQQIESQRLAAIGQTVAGLAHCVKNILNGIQGGSYILDRALAGSDAARIESGWTMVKRNTAFMSDLVLDMLSYAREREPVYEQVNPVSLLESIRELAALRAGGSPVEVVCDVDPGVTSVTLDATAMKRCLLNLATNAVEACSDGEGDKPPRVTLACAPGPAPGAVRFTVADNGCGIPEEHLENLFTMFFSTKGSKGTGLGLAVSHKIVEEHGGTIDVASRAGEGTTFTIDLPAEPAAEEPTAKTQA